MCRSINAYFINVHGVAVLLRGWSPRWGRHALQGLWTSTWGRAYTQKPSRTTLCYHFSVFVVADITDMILSDGQTSCGISLALRGFQHLCGHVLRGLVILRVLFVLSEHITGSTRAVQPRAMAVQLHCSGAIHGSASGMRDPSTWPYSKGLQCQLLTGGPWGPITGLATALINDSANTLLGYLTSFCTLSAWPTPFWTCDAYQSRGHRAVNRYWVVISLCRSFRHAHHHLWRAQYPLWRVQHHL